MNAFIKKEIRLLLPNFLFAAALALALPFIPDHADGFFSGLLYFASFVFCPALIVMVGLSSFGGEVSAGTLPNLLAQPMPREKIWETKITLLALALLVLAVIWTGAFLIGSGHGDDLDNVDWLGPCSLVITFGLVVFSGGLWTVLLLRQVAAAFWFTLIVPGAILTVLAALFSDHDGNFFQGVIVTTMGLYSLAGFFFARWLFLQAQDVQWSGGTIALPEMRGLKWWGTRSRESGIVGVSGSSVASPHRPRPCAALWRKELMLHQSQFVVAFVLLVLHLGVLAVRNFSDLSNSKDLKFMLEIFWGLWLVLPLLVGCAAVAEERKLGTLEGQLCLPVKRRTQFAIKFLVVIFLSTLLGAVMPLLLEGARILPSTDFELTKLLFIASDTLSSAQSFYTNLGLVDLLPRLLLAGIAILIGSVAFYISSLARNTLQTLAPAVLGILVVFFLLEIAGALWGMVFDFLWRGPLAYFIAVPIVLFTLLALTFWNFQQVRTSARMGWRNLLTLVFALVLGITATSAVYHRFWEKFSRFEPPHGTARLTQTDSIQLESWWTEISVRLPDGKIWNAPFAYHPPSIFSMLSGTLNAKLSPGTFYAGSNWMNIRRYGGELVGIKTDGTLWISESPRVAKQRAGNPSEMDDSKMRHLVQFGTETNWCSASPKYLSALLIKTDGSLWRLGTNHFDEKHQTWPGLRAFTPYRLGTDADWATVRLDYNEFAMVKKNGSIWVPPNGYDTNGLTTREIEPGFSLTEFYDGQRGKYRSSTQISYGLQNKVGIREDGTFRIWADMHLEKKKASRNSEYVWAPADYQLGTATNWLALAGGNEKVVTLKADGTLWLWDFRSRTGSGWNDERAQREARQTVPTQLGTHSDWIAVAGDSAGLVALAADGSLWFWPVESVENYYGHRSDGANIHPLLEVSRKPQLMGNVFSTAQ